MDKDFKTLFNETLHNYGVSVAKLAEVSGIPERYLEAMRVGNDELLPPDPYVRGYLIKIIALTGGNLEDLWTAYKNQSLQKTSGPTDRLPSNRFSLRRINKSKIALAVIIMLLIIYGFLRFDIILGNPELKVSAPEEAQIFSAAETIMIKGKINPRDKLTINGKDVITESDGAWSIVWPLTPGINNLEIKAKRFLGKEVVVTKKVIYAAQDSSFGTSSSSLLSE